MNRLSHLLFAAAIASALPLSAMGDEVWTFQFTPTGSRPFSKHCGGDCWIDHMTLADVAGTFSVLLNRQTGAARPLTLNGELINPIAAVWTSGGIVIQPEGLPWYQPLPAEIVLDQSPGHFVQQQPGLWRLLPDGARAPIPELEPYDIWFTTNSATFSGFLGFYDFMAAPRIQNAYATLLSITTAGDFNADNRIDTSDYISWRKSGGSATSYNLWRNFFGTSTASASGTEAGTIPEPAAVTLLATAAVAFALRRSRATA